jgi:hypothetical protein
MGIYGKVLGIANVLAIVAFLWLAGLDYGKRQSWQLAVREQEVLINGLPVDEKELDTEGRPVVSTINQKMLEQLFQGIGQPVKTGKQEVDARMEAVRGAVRAQENETAKRAKLSDLLLPLARSLSERESWRQRILKGNPDDLLQGPESLVDEACRGAADGKNPQGQALDADGWRQSIAHVLVNGSDSQELRRAMVVVGLGSYLRELNRQAAALAKMEAELQTAMARDRTAWELAQRTLLREIVGQSERLRALDETLQKQKELHDQRLQAQVRFRRENVEQLNQSIAKAQEDLKADESREARLNEELDTAQKGIANAKIENNELERQLKQIAARVSRGSP